MGRGLSCNAHRRPSVCPTVCCARPRSALPSVATGLHRASLDLRIARRLSRRAQQGRAQRLQSEGEASRALTNSLAGEACCGRPSTLQPKTTRARALAPEVSITFQLRVPHPPCTVPGPQPQQPRKTGQGFGTLTIALKRGQMATVAQCPSRTLKVTRKTSMSTVGTDAELTTARSQG